ncbi:MAG: hypothetical protein GX609_11460 [Actinomycetales bacterium]|jgi:hypothetical protein|nr:hypothetical protein [Actinomycetales bacterium]
MRSSTMRRARRLAAVGVAVALLGAGLAGCRTGEPEPADEPTVSEEPSASPEPTPEVTETAEAPDPEPAVNGPNSITEPLAGAEVPGPTVTVSGEGTAFEATLNYRVLRAGTDEVVAEGWTMAGANGEVGPYTFTVELEPGEYTVEVWEPDVSDGESGVDRHNPVEVTFTVV